MNRRGFAKRLLVRAVGLVVVGAAGVPALVTALFPAFGGRDGEAWKPVGRLDDFPVRGVGKAVVPTSRVRWPRTMKERAVYVWRPAADEVVVFSRSCTDLGCPVTWDTGSEWFFCPCHGGIFAKNGDRVAGPPDRPLYRYANRVRDGVVEIDLTSLPPMT